MRIAVDPGHGGKNIGARGHDIKEEIWLVPFATELVTALRTAGHEAISIRTADETVTFHQRGRRSLLFDADFVFCLHVNAVVNALAHGTMTFHLPKMAICEEIGNRILKTVPLPLRVVGRKSMVAVNAPGPGDDWIQAPINVITPHARHTNVVLVELFFCSNANDVEQMAKADIRKGLITAMVNAVGPSLPKT